MTGTVATNGNNRNPTDGVWLLDYRSGRLLGTVIDRGLGKISGWAEVDLVNEFNLRPRGEVHFLMTTGQVTSGQAALYLPRPTRASLPFTPWANVPTSSRDGHPRHDIVAFRPAPPKAD